MKITLSFDKIDSERDDRVAEFLKCLIDETLGFLDDLDSLE